MAVMGTLNEKSKSISENIIQWIGKEFIMESIVGMEFFEKLYEKKLNKEVKEAVDAIVEKKVKVRVEKEVKLKEDELEQERDKVKKMEQQVRALGQKAQVDQDRLLRLFAVRFEKTLSKKEKKLLLMHLELSGPDKLYNALLEYNNKNELRKWLMNFE